MVLTAARAGRMRADQAASRVATDYRSLIEMGDEPTRAWVRTYAYGTETTQEAMAALAVFDQLHAPIPVDYGAASSRTLFLGGRGEQARPVLESLVRSCDIVLANTQNWVRAHLYLGELDEQSGDKPSACAHYAKVFERWGHAKPRSVTADEARAHAAKLGCAP